MLGGEEIQRLLAACAPRDRLTVATALYTGLRISEPLGLTWDDIDFGQSFVHVRAQLSRAHRSAPRADQDLGVSSRCPARLPAR